MSSGGMNCRAMRDGPSWRATPHPRRCAP
jgi:hypothetical protein